MRIQQVGRYEVLETLARGGMGVVYKAKDPLIDRVVAVKTLGFGLSPLEAEDFKKRFAREATSAGRLSHPNIVTIHDMGESEDGAYIAMEFLEGRSLREILDSGVVLPSAKVAQIALQVADGLAFAHQHNVVHCDIKPGNIMVLERGTVKITDFGIAKLPTGSRTFAGNVLGSPRYISPEQIVGRPIDTRSDIFSLGAVLYEMLTGVAPFTGHSIDEILYQVINDKPEPPSSRNKSIAPAFDAIVERAMAKHPDDRYQSVQEIVTALRPLAKEESVAASVLPPIKPAPPSMPGSETVQLETVPTGIAIPDTADPAPLSRGLRAWPSIMIGIPVMVAVLTVGWMLMPARTANDGRDLGNVAGASSSTQQASEAPPRPTPSVAPPIVMVANPASTAPPATESPVAGRTLRATTTGPVAREVAPVSVKAATPEKPLARLGFAIAPWGEVYVDGKRKGVSPPLTELRLAPGTYVVEIRNTTFAPHTETVELGSDGVLRVKHRFQ